MCRDASLGEAYAYCRKGEGEPVPLGKHLENTVRGVLQYRRLISPLIASGNKLAAALSWEHLLAPSAAIAAALLHDIGKACSVFVEKCHMRGETGFRLHELASGHYVLKGYIMCWEADCHEETGISEEEAAALFALTLYGVIAHHHAMACRGVEALYHCESCGRRLECGGIRGGQLIPATLGGVENLIAERLGERGLELVRLVAGMTHRAVTGERQARTIDICGMREETSQGLLKPLFSPIPPKDRREALLRSAAFTIAGVVSAADTLAANELEKRPGKSRFYERLKLEIA